MDLVLIISDEEGLANPEFSLISPALEDEVDHSFAGGEGVANNLNDAFSPPKVQIYSCSHSPKSYSNPSSCP